MVGLVLYASSGPVLRLLGEQLIHADPPERVDAIVVLAPSLDRILEAANLYRAGYAPVVVLTREGRNLAEQLLIDRGLTKSGEERRRDILHALGVPLDAIVILEGFVGSTADEATFFAEWARTRPVRSVMVVTSPLHTARARLTFRHALEDLGIEVVVRPSTLDDFRADSWWQTRGNLRNGVVEWQKLLYYLVVELPRRPRVKP